MLWTQPRFDALIETLVVEGSPPVIYASHPVDSGVSSALFRSTDDGANWMPVYVVEAGLPQPPVRSLVVNPDNPEILFIATDTSRGILLDYLYDW